jgi:hypothetical protein
VPEVAYELSLNFSSVSSVVKDTFCHTTSAMLNRMMTVGKHKVTASSWNATTFSPFY